MASKFYLKAMFIIALAMMALALFSIAGISSSDAAFKKKGTWALTLKFTNRANPPSQLNKKPATMRAWLDFSNVSWQSWGGAQAKGSGLLDGSSNRVTFKLLRPKWCGGWRLYTAIKLISWEQSFPVADKKVHGIYRCGIWGPESVPNRMNRQKPYYITLTRKLTFDVLGRWKGWGTRRAYGTRVNQLYICGFSCYRGGTRARLSLSNIRLCQGILMYTRVTARWGGRKKVVQLGKRWCRER